MSRVETWIVVALLVLACLQCTRAIFFQNVSWVDLHLYSEGRERMPFQGRVAMMPLLRAASESRYMGLIAAAIDREDRHQVGRRGLACGEPFSPEKLASLLAGMLCTLLAVAILFARGRRFGALQWLPAVIFLGVLYASYAARYEEAYWYPYDLPHMLIFGAACLCLLDGPLWMFFPLFVLDLPMRETSVFLIVVAVPILVRRWRLPKAIPALAVMAALWLAVHLAITKAFAQNASETGSRLDVKFEKSCASPALASDGERFGFSVGTGVAGPRSSAGSLQVVSLLHVALPVGDCLVWNAHREPYFSGVDYANRLSRKPGVDELYPLGNPYLC